MGQSHNLALEGTTPSLLHLLRFLLLYDLQISCASSIQITCSREPNHSTRSPFQIAGKRMQNKLWSIGQRVNSNL